MSAVVDVIVNPLLSGQSSVRVPSHTLEQGLWISSMPLAIYNAFLNQAEVRQVLARDHVLQASRLHVLYSGVLRLRVCQDSPITSQVPSDGCCV